MLTIIAPYRKAVAAIAACLATIISMGVLTGDALKYTTIASTAVGAILVWWLENVPAEPGAHSE